MPSQLINVVENYGLVDENFILRSLRKLKKKELRKLNDDLFEGLKENHKVAMNLTPSSYNFFASTSLRGDRLCSHPICRLKKVPLLERYSALYGDHLILPIRTQSHTNDEMKSTVAALLLVVSRLRPLIDSGIVIPITSTLCLCEGCKQKVMRREQFVSEVGDRVAALQQGRFSVFYELEKSTGKHVFHISGPEEYVDGRTLSRVFDEQPKWISQPHRRGYLTQEEITQSGIISDLFNTSAFDITTQATLARHNGCSYLSDSESEAAFFEDPSIGKHTEVSSVQVSEALAHNVPLFSEIPFNTVLQLRREYPDAFLAYRSAIGQAIAQRPDLQDAGTQKIREFFRDVIEPQVNALKGLESSIQRRTVKAVGLTLGLPALSLIVGMLDPGLFQTASILSAAGIGGGITGVLVDKSRKQSDLESAPLFFLLKMDREWRRLRERCS